MNIAKFSIKRPVVTMMIIISMTILGFLVLINLKTQLMPNNNMPVARIRTNWRGASPDNMENLITKEIEKGLTKVEGIKRVTTNSRMGVSNITVEFNYGVIIDNKVNDLVTAVNRIRNNLPDDVDDPIITKSSNNADMVMMLGMAGKDLTKLKIFADNIVIPRLERIEGVASVDINGGDKRVVLVSIDPDKLESYGLNIADLYSILSKASLNFPAGYIREGGKEYLVRVYGEVTNLDEIQNIVLKNKNGQTLFLRDVANVKLDVKDRDTYGRSNGKDNIVLNISKTDTGNAVDISAAVQQEMKLLDGVLPPESTFVINRDTAIDITNSIGTVKSNAVTGLVLASLILLAFLKDLRATLVVSIAIPVSIIATFGFFGFKDITLNIMSLMGLSLGVGMLVDNSVVVLDNIFRHLTEYNENRMSAAEKGASEVIVPIIASTATTIAVFVPIVMRNGRAKEMYQDMCYAIAFSLIASLIIALTFVPMVSSRILKDKNRVHEDGKFLNALKNKYNKFLEFSLKNRILTIASAIILYVIFVIYGGTKIGGEFMPTVDNGIYTVLGEMPSGVNVDKANQIAMIFEKAIKKQPTTKKFTTTVSNSSVSIIVDVGTKDIREDKRPIIQIMNDVRKDIINTPDVTLNIIPRMAYGRGISKDFELTLRSDNIKQMEYISKLITDKMAENRDFVDISNSLTSGNSEARLMLDRKKLEYYGINVKDLGMSVSYQILGGSPISIKTGSEELDVTLQLNKKYRQSLDLLMDSRIRTSNGNSVKLKDVAQLVLGDGPSEINKEDKINTITIKANFAGSMNLFTAQKEVSKIIDDLSLPKGIEYFFSGDSRSMKEVNQQLQFAFMVAIFLVYFILAAQFESYILPLIVMLTVPLAITGVYMGLLVTNQKTNPMVYVGIIMLAGIVVNNAIVLIDYVQILIEHQKKKIHEALLIAGKTRLRPILMTTMTTVFGMIPLALGIGQGSERYRGMAIAVIFGLTFSTLLTLVVIPVMFELYYEIRIKLENKFYK